MANEIPKNPGTLAITAPTGAGVPSVPSAVATQISPALTDHAVVEVDRPQLRAQIRLTLKNLPMMEVSDGGELNVYKIRCAEECVRRGIRYPRLERIHRLLCGHKEPKDVVVVDNGPGLFLQNAYTMASLGSRVFIKELPKMQSFINQTMDMGFLPEVRARISVVRDIEEPAPADIVYWVNPSPALMYNAGLNYMGRDVVAGGFMVLQSDDAVGDDIRNELYHPDRSVWRPIYRRILDGKYGGDRGLVLQTGYTLYSNLFLVLQRK